MTTYQDPPLQSRRAARQMERADAQPYPAAPSAAPEDAPTPESLLYSTQGAPVAPEAPPARGRRAAEPHEGEGYRMRDFSPEARRVALQNWSQPAPAEGNLTYQTVQRPPAPTADAPAAPAPASEEQAPSALPDHTLTRRELRAIREAEAASAIPPLVEPAPWNATVPPVVAEPVAPVYEQPPVATTPPVYEQPPVATTPPVYEQPPVMTTPPVYDQPIVAATHYADPPSPAETRTTGDISAFEAIFGGQQAPVEPVAPVFESAAPTAPPVYEQPVYEQPVVEQPVYEQPVFEQLVYEQPAEQQYATEPPVYEAPPAPPQAYEPEAFEQPVEHPVEQPVFEQPVAAMPATTSERPVGHWSRQAELDDEAQFAPGSVSREVGAGITTTNALVLPEIPHHDFTHTAITSTGDILVTGSIELPRSLSSTGALPAQLDESDIDHILDPGDRQVASTDSQPVRAVKAVSTHTSSRGIINATPPKRGNKMLTALIISACAMLVVVVGLAVVIVTSNVLN